MGRIGLCLVLLAFAACGDSAATTTQGVVATSTTASPPSTLATTTTLAATTTSSIAVAPIPAAQTYEAMVSWDGTTCAYAGPEHVYTEDIVSITYSNDSADVADFEIDYLVSGSTIEELDEVTGDFIDRETVVFPDFILEVAFFPGGRGSLGAGETGAHSLVLNVPRVHAFTCFGGPASGDQVVDVASLGLDVEDYNSGDY